MGKQEINGAGGGAGGWAAASREGTWGWRGTGTCGSWAPVTQHLPEVTNRPGTPSDDFGGTQLLVGVTGVGAPPGHPQSHCAGRGDTGSSQGWCVGTRKFSQQGQVPGHSHTSSARDAPRILPHLSPASVSPQQNSLWGSFYLSSSSLASEAREAAASPECPQNRGTPGPQQCSPHLLPGCSPPTPRLTISLYYCNKCSHKSGRYWRAQRSLLLSYGNVISSVPGKFYKIVSGGIINPISSHPPG